MTTLEMQGAAARAAARVLAAVSAAQKNRALLAIAQKLDENRMTILSANAADMENARAAGIKQSFLDRLLLTDARIDGMITGVREVAALNDPCGEFISMREMPNGLKIGQRRVPLGVLGIIYEARPNVTVDAAVLCLKAGNTVILRGGKEAVASNTALTGLMRDALEQVGLPRDCVALVADISRESANEMMRLREYIDLLIPRGGIGLIRSVVENARVPVIETGAGNCHVYVDDSADLDMAAEIIENARCSRPSVCNSAETLLVARSVAREFLPKAKVLLDRWNVELRGDAETREILGGCVIPATEEDWATEYNDYILAIRVVEGLDEAMAHIEKYGTRHSECIVTPDY
ncbi:MAG: glutamate-5-semialdehyde dehydrogenase, partial [Firmicutes bacterium]|nr:glutamate-5-semialdehyde dehydrogenase [Bacillota bacterium]